MKKILLVVMMALMAMLMLPNIVRADIRVKYPTDWVYETPEDGTEIDFVKSGAPLDEIYGFRFTIKNVQPYISGGIGLSLPNGVFYDWGWENTKEGGSIKLVPTKNKDEYTITYLSKKHLYEKDTTYGTTGIKQYWGDDIEFVNVEILDKSGKTLKEYNVTEMSEKTATIYIGDKAKALVLRNPRGKVTWKSSNTKVVTVKDGKLTAVKTGTATITAKDGNKSYTCKVTVKNSGPEYKKVSLSIGTTYQIAMQGTKAKSYKSSNSKVITVNSKGVVTAKKAGKASVKVKAANGKTYTVNFKVIDSNKGFGVEDKSEGYEYKILSLDYYKGQKVNDWGEWVSIDVDKFHLFKGAVRMTLDYVADADETMIGMASYEGSAVDIAEVAEKYFLWVGDSKGQKLTHIYDFTKEETDKIRNAGRLQLDGTSYTINRIILEGVPSDEIEKRKAPEDSPVALHGRLRIDGSTMVDEKGEPFRLVGVGFDEGPTASSTSYINYDAFSYLRDDWKLNCVRISTTPTERMLDSYGFHEKWDIVYRHIDTAIQAAIDAGIYVLVDFHSCADPNEFGKDAEAFFKYLVNKYGDCPNIIYEITNEPYIPEGVDISQEDNWEQVVKYAKKIIPIIRAKAPNSVIAVGGPDWCQNMDTRIAKPLTYDNVIYTSHFYAASHLAPDGFTFNQIKKATEAGLPVLASESSAVTYTGAGEINFDSAKAYIDYFDENNIGYFYAGIFLSPLDAADEDNTNESIKKTCSKITGWKLSDYGEVAKWYRARMRARTDK